jgi:hypothetical protein
VDGRGVGWTPAGEGLDDLFVAGLTSGMKTETSSGTGLGRGRCLSWSNRRDGNWDVDDADLNRTLGVGLPFLTGEEQQGLVNSSVQVETAVIFLCCV